MSLAKKVKCPICKNMNEKETTVEISGKYYCQECSAIKEKELSKNKDDWDELYEYICSLYNIETLTGMMFKQIKDFRNIHNYTNKGILLTLQYYYETLENEVLEDTGLGIVVYYYEQAKKHYISKMEVKKHMKDFIIDETATIITATPNVIKQKNVNKPLTFETTNEEWDEVD